ncbi:bifunctional DNA primase/polymerase [Micavibrio aeruginosavorus]|uniref:Primase family protein n=1 Tax=Micavibrio aeruginosavorus (strain ARL-13) TaxID=856793 RepID=G2KQ16_MICAA|nr:bifunctional DNA primase/polymerase [Micavibrio aeruginosavorus]AEP10384.1 primase family protein [Micavibrio aeruginosavorus ARL-13]
MIEITEKMRSDRVLIAALAYAEAGWRIHPLKQGSKEPLLNKWPEKATSDASTIKKWFKQYPSANVGGIPPTGTFVLDIDGSAGKESYNSLGVGILTAKVVTPNNGSHRYFAGKVSKSQIGILKNLDLMADDGSRYLVLPPSKIKAGGYKWGNGRAIKPIKGHHLEKIEAILCSDDSKVEASGNVGEGARNETLFKIACTLRRKGINDDLLQKSLLGLNRTLCELPLSKSEVLQIADSSARYAEGHEKTYADMAGVKKEPVRWFWFPYMARGCMTIIEGAPGQGKSYLTMYLAALTSSGGTLPFSSEKIKAGRVLILNPEDDPARGLRPRLEKCGADLSENKIRFQEKFVPMDQTGIELLETEISSYRPDLVIIDPLLTYMTGDMHRYNDSTQFMTDIDQLAREYDCCIIGVRHLTKANNDDASKRGIGSVGFAARARSVLQVGKAPDDDEEKAMGHVKTNLGEYGKTLTFSLEGGGRDDVPKFVWERETDFPADALNKPREPGRPSEQEYLQFVLRQHLMAGPMKAEILMVKVQNEGIACSLRAVQRALNEIAECEGKGPKAKWMLKK